MSEFPNRNKYSTEKRAKSVNDAVLAALKELGATNTEIDYEIIDEGKKGIFGLGAKDAIVKVWLKDSVIAEREMAIYQAQEERRAKAKPEQVNTVSEKPRSFKKPRYERNEKFEKNERPVSKPRYEKTDKPEKTEKPEKPERSYKPAEEKPMKKFDNSAVFKQPEQRHTAKAAAKPVEEASVSAPAKKIDNSAVFKQPEIRHSKRREQEKTTPTPAPTPAPKPVVEEPRVWSSAEGENVDAAKKFLTDIFTAMDITIEIDAQKDQDGNLLFSLTGDNMGIIIGKRGDTLDSLQYLTSLVVNQNNEGYTKVTIDTENYREKRSDALVTLAGRLADKVAKTGKKFTLEPMNPYERRIIHSSLQANEAVTTFSIGTEPYRKVVIAPKNPRPFRRNNRKRPNNAKGGAPRPRRNNYNPNKDRQAPAAQKRGSYTTTYKADFKPQPRKAEFKSFDDYLAAHKNDDNA